MSNSTTHSSAVATTPKRPPTTPPEDKHKRALRRIQKESSRIVKKYMKGRDIPEWFRGTSNFQARAADKLNDSLLNDMEQRTSHRVRARLIELGLNPLIQSRQIRFLIKLSRANDLAFLWFLYELYYKTPTDGYSINEQLILSAMAHLDMIPTLRELNRILPPPVKEPPKPPKKPEKTFYVRAEDARIIGPIKNAKSPYLQPIRLPKPYTTVNTCERKDFRVSLGEYDKWADPHYVVPNEANRWFVDYKLGTSKRVVHGIIKEQLDQLFDEIEDSGTQTSRPPVMCEAHRQRAKVEEKLKAELQLIAREQCEKYFDVDGAKKEKVRARILAQMERDMEMFRDSYRRCAQRALPCKCKGKGQKAPIVILKGVDCFRECSQEVVERDECIEHGAYREENPNLIGDQPMPGNKYKYDYYEMEYYREERPQQGQEKYYEKEYYKEERPQKGQEKYYEQEYYKEERQQSGPKQYYEKQYYKEERQQGGQEQYYEQEYYNEEREQGSQEQYYEQEYYKVERQQGGQEKSCPSELSCESICNEKIIPLSNFTKQEQDAKTFLCECVDDDEEVEEELLTPCSSNIFFVAAQEHQPWRFDYQKVFHVKHPYNEQDADIKMQFAKAIDSDMSFKTKLESLSRLNVEKTVSTSAKRLWRSAVRSYNTEHPPVVKVESSESDKIPLDFGRDTYDPNDRELMTHMLRTAFDYMKQNPKFVLASLPEAYKLPTFAYFIENRYGKRYSLLDRQRLYLESLQILRALEKLTDKIPMPNIRKFCTNPFVSYRCRDYLLAKANRIKDEYYEELDNAIMRQARIFWFAMRPFLCTSGPPKDTYFAYMPSRTVDITKFRQWKSSEYMNAKSAWDARNRELRKRPFK